jgi:putative spermidine/putrescine transport system ATP-binding protein
MSAMVELRQVSKRFGDFTALDHVDFEIREGEFMTFLGPSGCGKTTCLRLISGFDTPTSGQVLIGGKDVTLDPPYRRDVNQVFQSYALFPHLTIYENIAFGLRMKGVSASDVKSRVDRVVEMTSLGEFVSRRPAQMSGGQRQRVALARAIVCEPKVLLLDEPLSALDAKVRVQLRDEIRRVQLEVGTTTLFVTHDQEEALAVADRVGVMNAGRLEQLAPPAELYSAPATRFVGEFVGLSNRLPADVRDGVAAVLGRDVPVLPGSTTGPGRALVRPESVSVVKDAEGPATVATVMFLGPLSRVTCTLADGTDVVAQLASSDALRLVPGDAVRLEVAPSPVLVVA